MPRFHRRNWPSEGPFLELLQYLDELDHAAGRPSNKQIGKEIRLKASTISPFFTGTRLINAGNLELLVEHYGGDVAKAEGLRRRAAAERSDRANGLTEGPSAASGVGEPGNAACPVPWQGVHSTLPADALAFTGRADEVKQVMDALEGSADGGTVVGINAVDGMAGAGKTALVVHLAHRLASRFPDGRFFVSLHANTPGRGPVEPSDALASLLLATGMAPQQVPDGLDERAGVWRDRISSRKVLIVLDDAEGTRQVRQLLPGSGEAVVLITSRRRLTALPAGTTISLDVMDPAEAAELFVRRSGREGLSAEDPEVKTIVALCGFLPLAISLVAGRFKHRPGWTVADQVAELADAADRVQVMRAEDDSVAAAFEVSYRALSPQGRRMFRGLGVHAGSDIDVHASAVLCGVPVTMARTLLDELYEHHVVEEPTRGRFRMHDLIKEHARSVAAAEDDAEGTPSLDEVSAYYLQVAQTADRLIEPRSDLPFGCSEGLRPAPQVSTRAQALAWFAVEWANIADYINNAANRGKPTCAVALADAVKEYLYFAGPWDEGLRIQKAASAVARSLGGPYEQALASLNLAHAHWLADDLALAEQESARALGLFRDLCDRWGQAKALSMLASLLGGSESARAVALLHEAAAIYGDLGDLRGKARVLVDLGISHYMIDEYEEALGVLTEAVEIHRALDDRRGLAAALVELGSVRHWTGQYALAVEILTEGVELFRESGDRLGQASALHMIGAGRYETGDHVASEQFLTESLALYRDFGDRLGEAIVLNDLGVAAYLAGDLAKAADRLHTALTIHRELERQFGQAEVLNDLGRVALAAGQEVEALFHHGEALLFARQVESRTEEARALEGLGKCRIRSGEAEQRARGISELRLALQISEEIGSPEAGRIRDAFAAVGEEAEEGTGTEGAGQSEGGG